MDSDNERVRVSAAALLRIRALAGGQYVLANTNGRWSPFGGAVQMQAPVLLLEELGWVQEAEVGRCRDVRGTVPRSALPAVHGWLASGADRETGLDCLRRELGEELAEAGARHLVDMVADIKLRLSLTLIEAPRPGPSPETWRYLEIFDLVDCTASDTPERRLREQILAAATAPATPRITTVPRSALTRRQAKYTDTLYEGIPIATHAHYVTARDF